MVMSYTGLIKAKMANLLETKLDLFGYPHYCLDQQLSEWLQLVLGLSESSDQTELNYIAPHLMLYSCSAVGGATEQFLEASAAVQFLHTASVIIDDIQDQDNPNALSARIGLGQALNLALFLLQLGEMTLCEAFEQTGQTTGYRMLSLLHQTIALGLRGQLLDLQDKSVPLSLRLNQPEAYLKKLALKTAYTSSYLAELGATLGGAPIQTSQIYREFGFAFGLSLHILDDLRDYLAGMSEPKQSNDLTQRYLTLAFIHALQEGISGANCLELWEEQSNKTELDALFQNKNAFIQTFTQALAYLVEAETALKKLDECLEKPEHRLLLEIGHNFAGNLYRHFSQIGNANGN
jgi:geranylgeranyl pyrophosphate synthase